MAEVYWIHLPEHTDMFSEGYIGVTKYTAKKRFAQHRERSSSSDLQNICKAIRKYGAENLIAETIVIAELDYCFNVESKLRPKPFIGWNIAIGGGSPNVGYKPSEEKKKAHSEMMKQWWVDNPDHDHSNKGRPGISRPRTDDHQSRIVEGKFYNLPFRYPWWANTELYYEDFVSGLSYTYAQQKNGLKVRQLFNMWQRFESGWIPSEDQRWKEVIQRYKEA